MSDIHLSPAPASFAGTFQLHSKDSRGSFSLPAPIASDIQSKIWLCAHPEGYLMVFNDTQWECFRHAVLSLPMSASAWRRLFLGSSHQVALDSEGRFHIDTTSCERAEIDRDAILIGVGSHLELWSPGRYHAAQERLIGLATPPAVLSLVY